MAIVIETRTLYFETPGAQQVQIPFKNTVSDFGAALKGFELKYDPYDHFIKEMGAQITNVTLSNDRQIITVEATLSLSDRSGNTGKGTIEVAVFADI